MKKKRQAPRDLLKIFLKQATALQHMYVLVRNVNINISLCRYYIYAIKNVITEIK